MSTLLASFRYTALPDAAEAFRTEVKEFLRTSFDPPAPQVRARSWMGFDAGFSRRLAARGWVGVTLPKRYGGAEKRPTGKRVCRNSSSTCRCRASPCGPSAT